jgi:uncharacterized protein (DUF2267 family)
MTEGNPAHQIDTAAQEAHAWVNEVAESVGCDRAQAYHALRAGLHALRDRMIWQEAVKLGQQLPQLIRGMWFENWSPEAPRDARHEDSYLNIVRAKLGIDTVSPDAAARATFKVLKAHLAYPGTDPETDGTLAKTRAMLPEDVRAMMDAA